MGITNKACLFNGTDCLLVLVRRAFQNTWNLMQVEVLCIPAWSPCSGACTGPAGIAEQASLHTYTAAAVVILRLPYSIAHSDINSGRWTELMNWTSHLG